VHVTELLNQHHETFTILGAWDGDPEKGLISYLTPVGQALLNRKPGEEVDLDLNSVKRRFRIDSIEAYNPPAPLEPSPTDHTQQPLAEAQHGSSEPVGAHS
jgi:hypothetical protein